VHIGATWRIRLTFCQITLITFWATVCKTVRRMLYWTVVVSVCLSVCLFVCPVLCLLSVTLVYCGQTVRQIKMKLGTHVSLGPGHIVSNGDPAPHKKGHSPPPQFSAHVRCGQMAGWTKMPLGMEVGLGPGDFVRWGSSSPRNKTQPPPTLFSAHVY